VIFPICGVMEDPVKRIQDISAVLGKTGFCRVLIQSKFKKEFQEYLLRKNHINRNTTLVFSDEMISS
jgi:hypothetical protein